MKKDYEKMWKELYQYVKNLKLSRIPQMRVSEWVEGQCVAYIQVETAMERMERRQNERIINIRLGGDFGNGTGEGSTVKRPVRQHIQHVGMR